MGLIRSVKPIRADRVRGGRRGRVSARYRAERIKGALLTFRVEELFPEQDPLSAPLLKLMDVTNDTRFVLIQFLRASRGLRRPRNRTEQQLAESEQSYLFRTLAGRHYESAAAFRNLERLEDERAPYEGRRAGPTADRAGKARTGR